MVKVGLKTLDTQWQMDETALLDCSATGLFRNTKFAKGNFISMTELEWPILVYNVDGTQNSRGSITHKATLMMSHKGHWEKITFEICDLGKVNIIGHTWLIKHNPEIDWVSGEIEFTWCPPECNVAKSEKKKATQKKRKAQDFTYLLSMEEDEDDEEKKDYLYFEEASQLLRKLEADEPQLASIQDEKDPRHIYELIDHWIRSLEKKPEKIAAELVPSQYHCYLDVFEKKASECMPVHKPWDHAINLVPEFKPMKSHIYPCLPMERAEIDSFIDDQLAKGYIQSSTLDQTSGVFFNSKKDGKKWMVQDYWYLNSKTIKNNYPLPLIPELVDKIEDAKVFTKMSLQWGYNNVWIREGDEGKAAFTCHRGAYEPLVMFFGLCNSPATFQTMMNNIFADLACVIVYIDDILIFTKMEEGHDEIVLEVLQRLKENDLFVKPEKCSFKVWEVEMLGLIIGLNGIKMDSKKVEAINDWPIPSKVKEVQSFLGLANFYRRFINNFSKIAKPLHELTHKDCVRAYPVLGPGTQTQQIGGLPFFQKEWGRKLSSWSWVCPVHRGLTALPEHLLEVPGFLFRSIALLPGAFKALFHQDPHYGEGNGIPG